METLAPAPKQETSKYTKVFFGATLLTLTALDLHLHHNGGVSDPIIRQQYEDIFGEFFTSHIGNFGFAAAATIPIVVAKKFLKKSDFFPKEHSTFDRVVQGSYILALATLLSAIILSESFPNNPDILWDPAFSIAGILNAIAVCEMALHEMGMARHQAIRNKPDPHFKLMDIPTSVDKFGFLSDIPTTIDQ